MGNYFLLWCYTNVVIVIIIIILLFVAISPLGRDMAPGSQIRPGLKQCTDAN